MGTLSIVSTPIGNLEDITIRAIKTLFTVDAILCEDTRHTGLLLSELIKRYGEAFDMVSETTPPLIPYYDEIEFKKLPEVIERLLQGEHLALVSDAGTPLISDPGYKLISECLKRNIKIESIPGPSAIITALTSSGMPTDTFMFLGYPPEKQLARIQLFDTLSQSVRSLKHHPTLVFYCAPHKLNQTLLDMKQVFGDIDISVARELTKIHEEIWNGNIRDAITTFTEPKGEFVLLIRLS